MEQHNEIESLACPKCKASVMSDFAHCPYCGHTLPTTSGEAEAKKKRNRILAVVVGTVLLSLLAIGGYWWLQRDIHMDSPATLSDSTSTPIDSSLLYEDEYQYFKRKKTYDVDISSISATDAVLFDSAELEEIAPTHCTYTKELNLQWPLSLKGVQHIDEMQSRLLALLFDQPYLTIDAAVTAFWKNAPTVGDLAGRYDPSESIKLERTDAPDQCVQFKVTQSSNNGGGTGLSTYEIVSFVTYDKTRQLILTLSDIFQPGTTPAVIAQINREIARINRKNKSDYNAVTVIPEQFAVGRKGITFVSIESMSYISQGHSLTVTVPYTSLTPYLTSEFDTMLNTPTNAPIHE